MQPAKVLVILDKPGLGGTATHVTSLVQSFDRAQVLPSVCFLLQGGWQESALRARGVPVVVLGLRRIYGWRALKAFIWLVRWMRRERFAIVHTYLFSANVFGVLAAWLARIPVVISSRREVVEWMRLRHRLVIRLVNRCCTAVVANAEAVRLSVLACERVPPWKVTTIANGVDVERFRPPDPRPGPRRPRGVAGEGPVVMSVGHLSPIKGQADLVAAARRLVPAHPRVRVVLVGDGPQREALAAHATRLGIAEQVIFLGRRDDIVPLLGMADVVAVPSRSEGCSNALLEAMAMGRAVVATDVGGNREIIRHGENGWLVPPADPDAMAQALLALLGDATLRERLGQQARRTVEQRFTRTAMTARFEQLYHALLTRHGHAEVPGPSIAYLCSQFPETHETFILREVLGLREHGIDLVLLSLKPCRDRLIHPEAHPLLPAVTIAPDLVSVDLWMSQLAMAARHPRRYVGALWWLVRTHGRRPVLLAKAMVVFLKAIALARRLAPGVRHLHAHWATLPTTAALVIGRLRDLPFSFTAHAWDLYVDTTLLPDKVRAAQFVITCTNANRAHLRSVCPHAPSAQVTLNYHGIDPAQFSASRTRRHLTAPPLVVSVGRLVETKGFPELIEACRLLRQRGVACRCRIIGRGPLGPSLRRQILRLGLEGVVTIEDEMPQEQLRGLYAEASIFALPCVVARNQDRDGIPNVLLEAMAMELPVVSTRVSGIPELIVDGVNGRLVPEHDPKALADAIEHLVSNPSVRRALGTQARASVCARFDVRRNVGELAQLFRERALRPAPVTLLYVIWGLEVGGAEKVVELLATHCDRRSYRPLVACLHRLGPLADRLRRQGIPVFCLGKRRGLDLRVLPKLIHLMRRERVEIVHTHLWTANLWGRLAAWLAGVPVIIATEHNVDTWKRPIHFLCDRLLSRVSATIVCVSESVQAFYQRHLPSVNGKLVTIYNGIEPARDRSPSPSPRPLAPAEGEWAGRFPLLAVIGRLVPAKGHQDCVDAVAMLRDRYPSLVTLFVGDGPLRRPLQEQIDRAGLRDAIRLTGVRSDIPALLNHIHLLLLPSTREGLPMVALEAMAAGVPVIATAVGGTPEAVVDGETGVLVPPHDPVALAGAIDRVLQDPARYACLSAQARRWVEERFTVARMVAHTEALYRRGGRP